MNEEGGNGEAVSSKRGNSLALCFITSSSAVSQCWPLPCCPVTLSCRALCHPRAWPRTGGNDPQARTLPAPRSFVTRTRLRDRCLAESSPLPLQQREKMTTSKRPLRLPGSQCCYRTCICISHSVAFGLRARPPPPCCPLGEQALAAVPGRGRPPCPPRRGAPVPMYLYKRDFVTSNSNKETSRFRTGGAWSWGRGPRRRRRRRGCCPGGSRVRRFPAPRAPLRRRAAGMAAALLARGGGAPRGEGRGFGLASPRLLGGLRGRRGGREGAAACAGGGAPVPFRA